MVTEWLSCDRCQFLFSARVGVDAHELVVRLGAGRSFPMTTALAITATVLCSYMYDDRVVSTHAAPPQSFPAVIRLD